MAGDSAQGTSRCPSEIDSSVIVRTACFTCLSSCQEVGGAFGDRVDAERGRIRYAGWSTRSYRDRVGAAFGRHDTAPSLTTCPRDRSSASASLDALRTETFDLVVVGGGVTGAGVVLDAASRGMRAALIERDDFASGTSSKSSKLVHGGLRYLQQGEIGLVYEALAERQRLLDNAPHLVRVAPVPDPDVRQGRRHPRQDLPHARRRHVGLRPHRRLAGRPDPQAARQGRGARVHADAARGPPRVGLPLLRRRGRRRPTRAHHPAHRGARARCGHRQRCVGGRDLRSRADGRADGVEVAVGDRPTASGSRSAPGRS